MTNQQGAPEALRTITRYEVVDCIDSKHVPAVIPNKDGPWVLYEDHVAALVEAQQPAPSAAGAVSSQLHDIDAGIEVMAWLRESGAPHSIYSKMSACLFGDPDAPKRAPTQQPAPATQQTLERSAVPAEWLEQAYREGWAACRDAETIGGESEDWSFGNSTANSRMIDAQQAAPQPSTTPQEDSQPCCFGSPELQAMILAKCVEKDRADSQPAPVRYDLPTGAIINGRALAERLENGYNFECEAGPLSMCSDWQEFVRCFDYLATWADNRAARAPADSVTAPAYSIDADPQGIRARVAEAITGAMAFGVQGANPPPPGHWLAPFWESARWESIRAKPVHPSADTLYLLRRLLSNQHTLTGSEFRAELGKIVEDAHAITPPAQATASAQEDAARWQMAVLIGNQVMLDPEKRTHPAAVKAYMDAVHSGLDLAGAVDAARKQGDAA